MKKKGLICFMSVFLVFTFVLTSEASVFQWRNLGRAPLFEEVITDKLDLQEKFPLHKDEIVRGLRLAEPTWDAERIADLMEMEIRKGVLEEVSFPPGKRFDWMIFKPKSGVSLVRNVEWVGNRKTELQGYLTSCHYGEEELKFFLVKICGNLTLLERKQIPPIIPPKVETPPPAPPPRYSYQQDLCANIEGLQTRVPEGMVQDGYGNCIQPRTEQPPVNNYYSYNYYQQETLSPPQVYEYYPPSPPPVVSYFPLPRRFLFPFFFYDEDRYDQRRGYQHRGYQPRYHQRDYQPRVRPPTVHTRPSVQSTPRVRPPGVRTR